MAEPSTTVNSQAKSAGPNVGAAMAADRPAKTTIRNYWADEAEVFQDKHNTEDFPIYTTLSGAEARDIYTLIDRQVIRLTETGAILSDDLHKVVAIESSPQKVLELQRHLTGLKIIEQDFKSIIRGDTPLIFPDSLEHRRCCCASIVNLDLNTSLTAIENAGQLDFPIFTWIQKLSQLHVVCRPNVDWCLCLTLHAQIDTPDLIGTHLQHFLRENFLASPAFEVSCGQLIGPELLETIKDESVLDLTVLDTAQIQKLLMVFVPKKIARNVHGHGWKISTIKNLSYGGTDNHAPMVTWILYFIADARAGSQPQAIYTDSINDILTHAGNIEVDGTVNSYM